MRGPCCTAEFPPGRSAAATPSSAAAAEPKREICDFALAPAGRAFGASGRCFGLGREVTWEEARPLERLVDMTGNLTMSLASAHQQELRRAADLARRANGQRRESLFRRVFARRHADRSEEHTSELQSRPHLV